MVKGRGKGVDDNQDPEVGRTTEPIERKRRVKHVARKGATKKKIASNASEPASSARVGVKRKQPDKSKRKTKPQTKKFKSGTPSDVNVGIREFVSKSRCQKMVELMDNFSVHQKRDVMEIGFGHLLSMKLTKTVSTMLPWLVDCFDHGSCMFLFGGKEFMIDEYDVYDVFGLPLNPSKDVVEISRTANERNPDFHIKLKWRNDFNVGPNENIKLSLIEERIKDLDMGGEEFKRMFVMHAFSSFFAPTANRTADLRIAKCLVDVDEIRTYNWSKYVLDRLCEAVRKYKNGDLDYFTGCVMLLQLVYFHRLKFRNKEVGCSLPLVQHWTDENVKDRVSSETKAVCFGCGCLDTTTYPVSKKLHFVDGQAVEYRKDLMEEVNYKGKEKSSEGHANDFDAGFSGSVPNVSSCQQSITFPLPLGTPSTEEILSRESDDVRALFLLMKRDLEVVTNFHIAALKEKVRAQLRASPSSPIISQTQTFFSDPKVFETMDEIVNLVLSVKNMPGGLNEVCTFVEGNSGGNNAEGDMGCNSGVVENARTNQSGNDDNNVQSTVVDNNNGDGNGPGNNDNNLETNDDDNNNNGDGDGSGGDGDNDNNDGNESGDDDNCEDRTVFGCALTKNCSIDIEEMNLDGNVVFVSYFMRNHSKDMRGLRPLHQELCDYCFINDSEMDSREVMVWLHPNYIVHRDDMVSIGSNSEIFCCLIDCWALMLNENERRKKGEPVKFFFNVSQSVKFLELAFQEDNATQVDELQSCWYEWLTVNNHGFNLECVELADQVSTFFDGMGLVNAPYIIDYPMEFVTLNWKSSKQNVDCGLYVMMSMLLFDGSDEFSYDNLKTAPKRRVLRAKICAALVLSDRNDVRSEILDKMKAMRPSRPQLQKEVEQRRKQEMEDLKKKEYAAKRAVKKN
ncbi:Halomucin [Bienertia sinuspersici]